MTPKRPTTQNRLDLTNWLFHFVHGVNVQSRKLPQYAKYFDGDERQALYFDKHEEPIYSEYDFYLKDLTDVFNDDSAFGILNRILIEGFLRPTWSFRKGHPTVYGSHSAVCFTEMPLSGLVKYINSGINKQNTSIYGIALQREELFASGGRNAIYGLSGQLRIADDCAYRLIDAELLNESEQYRYIATNLGSGRIIDWTHEREWRWKYDEKDVNHLPGMPIWYSEGVNPPFTKVMVLVRTKIEQAGILNLLKQQFDAHGNIQGIEFSREIIANTHVICIEDLNQLVDVHRFEDLKAETLNSITLHPVSEKVKRKVERLVKRAQLESQLDAVRQETTMLKSSTGQVAGECGFTWIKTDDGNSEITRAMLDLGLAESAAGEGYYINAYSLAGVSPVNAQVRPLQESAARVAASILTKGLKQKFYVYSKLD